MSPELLRRAQREARRTQRLARSDRWARDRTRYPRDYYRPVDRAMITWLRAATSAAWRIQS